jgi:hypothetical protein
MHFNYIFTSWICSYDHLLFYENFNTTTRHMRMVKAKSCNHITVVLIQQENVLSHLYWTCGKKQVLAAM